MPSVAVLNAVLNAALWLAHSLLAVVLQGVYVAIARLQLAKQGKTRATDSEETNVVHWFTTGIAFSRKRSTFCDTAIWSFALMLFALLFLPAELVFETGLDVRNDCPAEPRNSSLGVCSSPWAGHSDVGVASAALLVQRFSWVDPDWEVVFEGASKTMWAGEVHRLQSVRTQNLTTAHQRIFAYNCTSTVSSCDDCGQMNISRGGGSFSNIVVNATLAHSDTYGTGSAPGRFAHGDVTFDNSLGAAFFFWEMPEENVTNNEGTKMMRIHARGMETILSDIEVERLSETTPASWNVDLIPSQTRLYNVTCDTPGLESRDMVHAASLFRTTQMEQPGVELTEVGNNLTLWTPFNSSHALQALFSLKAEDGTTTCKGVIPVYSTCGSFDWHKAIFFISIGIVSVVGWVFLFFISRKVSSIDIPHDSRSWREYALSDSKKQGVVQAPGERGGSSGFLVLRSKSDATSSGSSRDSADSGEIAYGLDSEGRPHLSYDNMMPVRHTSYDMRPGRHISCDMAPVRHMSYEDMTPVRHSSYNDMMQMQQATYVDMTQEPFGQEPFGQEPFGQGLRIS